MSVGVALRGRTEPAGDSQPDGSKQQQQQFSDQDKTKRRGNAARTVPREVGRMSPNRSIQSTIRTKRTGCKEKTGRLY